MSDGSGPGGKPPLRQVIKEWGEAVDVWTRIAFRFGLLGIGLSAGATVAEVLEKLVG